MAGSPAIEHEAVPSPWPFFLPITGALLFFGLALHSWPLVLAGLGGGLVSLVGWYRDALVEWRQAEAQEAGVAAPHVQREASSVRPLIGFYAMLSLVAVLATAVPKIPTSGGSGSGAGQTGTVSDGKVTLVADQVKFDLSTIDATSGQAFTVVFDNKDQLPHNLAIFAGPDAKATNVFRGPIDPGPKTDDYQIPALKAGTYYFQCDVHPGSMYGTLIVK